MQRIERMERCAMIQFFVLIQTNVYRNNPMNSSDPSMMIHSELIAKYDSLCDIAKQLRNQKSNNIQQKAQIKIDIDQCRRQNASTKQSKIEKSAKLASMKNDIKQLTKENNEIKQQLKSITPQIKETKMQIKQLIVINKQNIKKQKQMIKDIKQQEKTLKQVIRKHVTTRTLGTISQEQYLESVKQEILDDTKIIPDKLHNVLYTMNRRKLASLIDFSYQTQEAKDDTLNFLRTQQIPHVYIDQIDHTITNPEKHRGILSFYPKFTKKQIQIIRSNDNIAHIIGGALFQECDHSQFVFNQSSDSKHVQIFDFAIKTLKISSRIRYDRYNDLVNFGVGVYWIKNYQYIRNINQNKYLFSQFDIQHTEPFELPVDVIQELNKKHKQQYAEYLARMNMHELNKTTRTIVYTYPQHDE